MYVTRAVHAHLRGFESFLNLSVKAHRGDVVLPVLHYYHYHTTGVWYATPVLVHNLCAELRYSSTVSYVLSKDVLRRTFQIERARREKVSLTPRRRDR